LYIIGESESRSKNTKAMEVPIVQKFSKPKKPYSAWKLLTTKEKDKEDMEFAVKRKA
jgi:hypothetical protein